MFRKVNKIHFVGIGGIGMSGIAELLINLGFSISGSDINKTEITEKLTRMGQIFFWIIMPQILAMLKYWFILAQLPMIIQK